MTGIYIIENLDNGKCYIGSAVNIKKRWRLHKYKLSLNKHHSKHLQAAWNQNPSCFVFKILEIVPDKRDLLEREQWWLDITECYKREYGYNTCVKAGSWLGMRHSEIAKQKVSIANKGKKRSEENKRKLTEAHKGTKKSEEAKLKLSKTYYGFVSPEGKEIIITNLRQFCKENNLNNAHMYGLISGKRKQHKGWTYANEGRVA